MDHNELANTFMNQAGGHNLRYIGVWRWSDPNESYTFTAYTPDNQIPVLVLFSYFPSDNTIAFNVFSNENVGSGPTSELNRYENLVHVIVPAEEMAKLVQSLDEYLTIIDGYNNSWVEESILGIMKNAGMKIIEKDIKGNSVAIANQKGNIVFGTKSNDPNKSINLAEKSFNESWKNLVKKGFHLVELAK